MMIPQGTPRTHSTDRFTAVTKCQPFSSLLTLRYVVLNNGQRKIVDNQNLKQFICRSVETSVECEQSVTKDSLPGSSRPAWHQKIYSSAGVGLWRDLDQACCSTCRVLQRRGLTEVQPSSFSFPAYGCLTVVGWFCIKPIRSVSYVMWLKPNHDQKHWLWKEKLSGCRRSWFLAMVTVVFSNGW